MSQLAQFEPLIEFDLLSKYIGPRSAAWRAEGHLPWLLNASVIAGSRSPKLAAEWAQNQKIGHRAEIIRTLNLASDTEAQLELEHDLAAYDSVASNLSGSLEGSIDQVISTLGVDPAFVLVSPFQNSGVRTDLLARLLSRRGRKTELLARLDISSFEELRENLTSEQIDEIVGSSLWRKLWEDGAQSASFTRISVLYRTSLQRRGFTFAREIPLHTSAAEPASSYLIFASRSRLGVALMSDLVCRYRRAHCEPQKDIKELYDQVYELGGRLESASTNRIVQGLSAELFGEFQITDYRRVLRELVRRELIDRADCNGIEDDEILAFNGTSQMALFDSQMLTATAAE